MNIAKYLNKNKVGGLILIIVIIIAFGFGGFGGGFMSNNQNNIAKINKINVTTQDFIDYMNQSNISQQVIKNNLDNNIIEELLSALISKTLLNLEVKDFDIMFSKNSLSKKIKNNENFIDDNKIFQRIKYEKFLLENNISAPEFEQRLKERELQKKLFDFIGAGTISPKFFVNKLLENENKKLKLNFVDLEKFYKKKSEFDNKEIAKFIDENREKLKVNYLNFEYSIINPKNLTGEDEFSQIFFDKIDEIENSILNGISFNDIISEFDLNKTVINNYRYSENSNEIEKKIYEFRDNNFDIFENKENFVIYKIKNIEERKPDINDEETKNEILSLIVQKSKFDFNREILEKINDNEFSDSDFTKLGESQIQSITLNSIKDNKKFDINAVEMLYSLPINSFTLINDEDDKIYLAKIINYEEINTNNVDSEKFESYKDKETTNNRNSILKSYDIFLNKKYSVDINQKAIDNVKNLF